MTERVNDFSWWQDALAGKHAPIDVNTPQSGFYKVRRKGHDGHLPCAFWWDSHTGEVRCHLNGKDYDEQRALEIWPFASKNPVSTEDYGERVRTGKWPGEHEAVRLHNQAPPDDSPEAIAERIADLAREAEKMIAAGAAPSDAVSDQASDLANTFGELEGKADRLRIAEKAPHLEATRAVDGKWQSIISRAAELKRRLKFVVVTPFLNRKTEEANRVAIAAISSGTAPEALPQPKLTAGASKRPTALRTQTSAEVTDWPVLLATLHEHPDIRDTAQRIANASAKAGVALPGTRIITRKVAA